MKVKFVLESCKLLGRTVDNNTREKHGTGLRKIKMKRNDRRGLELLCMSIIGWRSLQSALLIGCDVRLGVGTLIVMECGAEWVVLVQELEWGKCCGGEGYFEHFQGDVLFCFLPGPVAKYWSQCVYVSVRGVSIKLSSRATVFYDTFFWLLVYLSPCVTTVRYYY